MPSSPDERIRAHSGGASPFGEPRRMPDADSECAAILRGAQVCGAIAPLSAPQDDGIPSGNLPLVPCRTAPVLQRRPDAAAEPEAIDRGRGSQRLEAVQFDAAPLEAAFFQN